jgi:enterochelin esterase-like enzyme
MTRLFLALAALFALFAAPAAAQGRFVEFDQPADIGQVHLTVWLPPGYDKEPKRRYPVLYMHDGQNVFFPKRSGFNKVWAADKAALSLINARKIAPFMIVAVDHPGAPRPALARQRAASCGWITAPRRWTPATRLIKRY